MQRERGSEKERETKTDAMKKVELFKKKKVVIMLRAMCDVGQKNLDPLTTTTATTTTPTKSYTHFSI